MNNHLIICAKQIYDYNQSVGGSYQFCTDGIEFGTDAFTLRSDVAYLKDNNYVTSKVPILNTYCLMITEKGEQFVENDFKLPSETSKTVFNIGSANNSIIGTQENATITNGHSIEDLTSLIDQHDSLDKELLKEMVSILETAISNQKPIKKGLLSKFAGVLQRNEWITAPIATLILEKIFMQ